MKKALALLFAAAVVILCSCSSAEGYELQIESLKEQIRELESQIENGRADRADTAGPSVSALPQPGEERTSAPSVTPGPSASDEMTPTAGEDAQLKATAAPHADGDANVYITKTGKKYHRLGCRHLAKSCIPISLDDAKAKGYTPCKVCKPPG